MVSISIARAALPENGLTIAVGRASTKRESIPAHCTRCRMPSRPKSNAPDARNTPTAQSIATRYGSRLLATSKPSFAPSTKASYTFTFLNAAMIKNTMIKPNNVKLPRIDDRLANAVADSPASSVMNPPSSSAPGIRYARTTGSHSRKRCMKATDSNPTRLEALVASKIGRNTSVGSTAPC